MKGRNHLLLICFKEYEFCLKYLEYKIYFEIYSFALSAVQTEGSGCHAIWDLFRKNISMIL